MFFYSIDKVRYWFSVMNMSSRPLNLKCHLLTTNWEIFELSSKESVSCLGLTAKKLTNKRCEVIAYYYYHALLVTLRVQFVMCGVWCGPVDHMLVLVGSN